MPDRIIVVITDEGKTAQVEPCDATDHVAKLELTPTKQEKRKPKEKD